MIIEFLIKKVSQNSSYIQSMYEILEELNCYYEILSIDEETIKFVVYGKDFIINWLVLRMYRYHHYQKKFNKYNM